MTTDCPLENINFFLQSYKIIIITTTTNKQKGNCGFDFANTTVANNSVAVIYESVIKDCGLLVNFVDLLQLNSNFTALLVHVTSLRPWVSGKIKKN